MSPAGITKIGFRRITLKSKRLEIRLGDIMILRMNNFTNRKSELVIGPILPVDLP